jgi:uncharacterized membrane protein YbhN (UPF0104 family)
MSRAGWGARVSVSVSAGHCAPPKTSTASSRRFYSGHRLRLLWSLVFAMGNWVLGAVEVYLIMTLLGFPLSFAEVWMIECMVQLVRTIAFFIPAGLGAQEGAFLVAVGALTGVPSAGVATALVRRFRDVLWIALSLAVAAAYAVTPGALRARRTRRCQFVSAGAQPSMPWARNHATASAIASPAGRLR